MGYWLSLQFQRNFYFNFTDTLMTYLQQTSGESFRRGQDWPAQQWPLGPYCPCSSPGWWCPVSVRLSVFLCGVYSPGRRLCCQWSVWWCPPSIPTTTYWLNYNSFNKSRVFLNVHIPYLTLVIWDYEINVNKKDNEEECWYWSLYWGMWCLTLSYMFLSLFIYTYIHVSQRIILTYFIL